MSSDPAHSCGEGAVGPEPYRRVRLHSRRTAVFEVRVNSAEAAKAKVTFLADVKYPMRHAFSGAVSILSSDDVATRDAWLAQASKAGIAVLAVTRQNADPLKPDPALVESLAQQWIPQPVMTQIDNEICVGWDVPEPTRFMREVSSYLHRTDKARAAEFEKKFMQGFP